MRKIKIFTLIISIIVALFYYKRNSMPFVNCDNQMTAAVVVDVIDGDTILVEDYLGAQYKVRMNLINTPESVHMDENLNSEYGTVACEYLSRIIKKDDIVYLQFDNEIKDIYGRTLAYVWLEDDVDINNINDVNKYMVNAILINSGYAQVVLYNNKLYYDMFKKFEYNAQINQIGFWKYDVFK